ncbi:MAG: hypothetical protein WC234_03460 [Endomicrobiaceae bacterium]
MFKRKLLLIFCFMFAGSFVLAKKPPTLPNSYNAVSVSARSFAMGQAGVAVPANLEGIFYNPASIAYIQEEKIQAEMLFTVSRESGALKNAINMTDPIDIGFDSFAAAQRQGALSWRTLSSNKVEISDGSDWYNKQENIKAITISAGNQGDNGSAMGLNISYLYGTLAESSYISGIPFAQTSSGNGVSVDIGFMTPVSYGLTFGVNFENVVGFMWWENYDFDQLPFGIRTGLGYNTQSFSLLLDFDKKFYRFGDINENIVGVGLEQYITSYLCLRLGAQGSSLSDNEKLKYTYGIGLNISTFMLSVSGEKYKLDEENISKYLVSLRVLI